MMRAPLHQKLRSWEFSSSIARVDRYVWWWELQEPARVDQYVLSIPPLTPFAYILFVTGKPLFKCVVSYGHCPLGRKGGGGKANTFQKGASLNTWCSRILSSFRKQPNCAMRVPRISGVRSVHLLLLALTSGLGGIADSTMSPFFCPLARSLVLQLYTILLRPVAFSENVDLGQTFVDTSYL